MRRLMFQLLGLFFIGDEYNIPINHGDSERFTSALGYAYIRPDILECGMGLSVPCHRRLEALFRNRISFVGLLATCQTAWDMRRF